MKTTAVRWIALILVVLGIYVAAVNLLGFIPTKVLAAGLLVLIGYRIVVAGINMAWTLHYRSRNPTWFPAVVCDDDQQPLPLKSVCLRYLRGEVGSILVFVIMAVRYDWILAALWITPAFCFALIVASVAQKLPDSGSGNPQSI